MSIVNNTKERSGERSNRGGQKEDRQPLFAGGKKNNSGGGENKKKKENLYLSAKGKKPTSRGKDIPKRKGKKKAPL